MTKRLDRYYADRDEMTFDELLIHYLLEGFTVSESDTGYFTIEVPDGRALYPDHIEQLIKAGKYKSFYVENGGVTLMPESKED